MEQFNHMSWGEELYHGEADDLIMCNLYAEDKAEPILPDISGWKSKSSYVESDINPNHDVLQVWWYQYGILIYTYNAAMTIYV